MYFWRGTAWQSGNLKVRCQKNSSAKLKAFQHTLGGLSRFVVASMHEQALTYWQDVKTESHIAFIHGTGTDKRARVRVRSLYPYHGYRCKIITGTGRIQILLYLHSPNANTSTVVVHVHSLTLSLPNNQSSSSLSLQCLHSVLTFYRAAVCRRSFLRQRCPSVHHTRELWQNKST